jgi:transposase InsO family protein
MPWKEILPMDQRVRFVVDVERGGLSMSELCERYGVSRKTGYKWLARYADGGAPALAERSRRPAFSPQETPSAIVDALIEGRQRHPTWGAKKLLWLVGRKHPGWSLPARSTVCDLLKRHGLVRSPRRRRLPGHPGKPMSAMAAPNDVWCADFKGQFRTRDGVYCYPLTVTDGFSRYLLGCQSLLSTAHVGAKPVFERLFREHGMPRIIRTDNGVPFATNAIARLSELSVWWIRLGIKPELTEPASPQQNGRHERMHRTLKAETTRPPAGDLRAQQRRFNDFQTMYNHERPHEAIGQQTPATLYAPSDRAYPRKLPPLEYPSHFERRLVSRNGGLRWNRNWVNVSHTLGGEYVGLEEIDHDLWTVYFGPLELGRLHVRELTIEDTFGRTNRKNPLPMSPD